MLGLALRRTSSAEGREEGSGRGPHLSHPARHLGRFTGGTADSELLVRLKPLGDGLEGELVFV